MRLLIAAVSLTMKKQVKTNFGAAAEDYAKFRAGFPDSFFDRLAAFGIRSPGEVVVDVGTGIGTLSSIRNSWDTCAYELMPVVRCCDFETP